MALHTVSGTETINSSTSYPDGILIPMGTTLVLQDGTNLETPYIDVMGRLLIGTMANPILYGDSVVITLDGDTPPPVSPGDPSEGGIRVHMSGRLEAYGPEVGDKIPWTVLAADALVGASSIVVDDATGWSIGDQIVLAPSGIHPWEDDERTITNVVGTTITLDSPLTYNHAGGRSATPISYGSKSGTINMSCEVANLTRPIVIQTDPNETYGAHIMCMHGGTCSLKGVQLSYMGMTEPNDFPYKAAGEASFENAGTDGSVAFATPGDLPIPPVDAFDPNNAYAFVASDNGYYEYDSGSMTWVKHPTRQGRPESPTGKGLPGKYAVHIHHAMDASIGDYITNCVSYRGRHKAFVIHRTNGMTLHYNIAYRGKSHQFSIGEDGFTKDTVVTNNLVVYARRLYNGDDASSNDNDWAFPDLGSTLRDVRISGGSHQNEMHPGAFWITGPQQTITDNVVAGCLAGVAFYFDFHGGRVDGTFSSVQESQKNGTLTCLRNRAHSCMIESGFRYGTTQDVNAGTACRVATSIGFAYRGSGLALWMDQFSPDFSTVSGRNPRNSFATAEGTEYVVEDFEWYNCTAGVWCESPSFRLKNFRGVHMQMGIHALGGFFEDGIMTTEDILGAAGISALTTNPADQAGLTDESQHEEGFFVADAIGSPLCNSFTGITGAAFNIWSVDKANQTLAAKGHFSIHDVVADTFYGFLRSNQPFDGMNYLSSWEAPNEITGLPIRVEEGIATAYLTSSPSPYTITQVGATRASSTNVRNAALFDLDNDLVYFMDGSTDTASNWMVVKVISTNGVDLDIIDNTADGAATWFDTNQLREFSSGTKDPGYGTMVTGIFPVGSSQTFTTTAPHEIQVYGTNEGDTITINGVPYTYEPGDFRDGWNIEYLLGTTPPPAGTPGTSFTYFFPTGFVTCTNGSCVTGF